MITPSEARAIARENSEQRSADYVRKLILRIRAAAHNGRTSTTVLDWHEELWPALDKIIDMGYNIEWPGTRTLIISWREPKYPWYLRLWKSFD